MKLLLRERGSDEARALWNTGDIVVVSWITFTEASAALGAAVRAGRITPAEMKIHRSRLVRAWRSVTAIDADGSVAAAAARLALSHRLRGMDAIHLATALIVRRARPVLVTWDEDLARAATEEGLSVAGAA